MTAGLSPSTLCFPVCGFFSVLLLALYLQPLAGVFHAGAGRAGVYRAVEADPLGLPSGHYGFYFHQRRSGWRVSVSEMPACGRLPPGLKAGPGGPWLEGRFESEEEALEAALQWAAENQSRLAGGL